MLRFAFLVLLCLVPSAHARADAPAPVVASFSILGDLVKSVGGDRVAVETLVGPNGDTHAYTPKPTDAKKLAAARLIVVNGLDFERWLDRLRDSANTKAVVVVASRGVQAREAPTLDPHAWQAPSNVRIYVANIRDALTAADPSSKETYDRNAIAYLKKLDELDRDIRAVVALIPEARRRAVTPHPSFGYFGDAYGLQMTAIQFAGHDAEISAKALAQTIQSIRHDRVAAIFQEATGDQRIVQQIASESGARLGGVLYSDALTEADGAAPTYLALMRHNLRTIENALRD